MLEKIKKNKWIILFCTFLFTVFSYCCFQTFIINDDLPYSFFLRGENRVTDIKGIIINQLYDYGHINARIVVHSIVQFLLMFEKDLWSIINPLIIVLTIYLMAFIVIKVTRKEDKKLLFIILSSVFFLLLYNYKYLIYWVAGSVNYVFIFVLMLLFILYYYKLGLNTKPITTMILCFILSLLHESLGIFIITLIVGDFVLNLIQNKEKNKQFYLKYVGYLMCAIAGMSVILLSPVTLNRFDSGNDFQTYSFIEKLSLSIPGVSNNIFGLFNIYNLFPMLLIASIFYNLFKHKSKFSFPFLIICILLGCLSYFLEMTILTFLIAIIVFLTQSFIFYRDKNYKFICILLAIYAVSYSMIITPEYVAGRPNYHFCLLIGIITIINLFNNIEHKKIELNIIKAFSVISFIICIFIELNIYSYIGNVKDEREQSIEEARNKNIKVIELKQIKAPYSNFHPEANSPASSDYWAYKEFLNFYDLEKDVEVKIVE